MKKRRYKGRGFWYGVAEFFGFIFELLFEIIKLPFRAVGKIFDDIDF